jgi:hypothetical protein
VKLSPKPTFCFITPTAYLEEYASQSQMHLILAHLVDTDEVYAKFYAGQTVPKIMDCSAFELGESYAPDKLIELGHKCKADAVVLPDYPFKKGQVTIDSAYKFMRQFKAEGFKTMFVPQSEIGNMEDWIAAYEWASNCDTIDIIGMSILGMPNAIPHVERSFARVVLTQILIDRGLFNFDKHHHYLGLNSAPNVEIPTLLRMKALDSNDSSGPVWSAINGFSYNESFSDWMGIAKKYLREVDFDQPDHHKAHIHAAIQHNMDLTNQLFL